MLDYVGSSFGQRHDCDSLRSRVVGDVQPSRKHPLGTGHRHPRHTAPAVRESRRL